MAGVTRFELVASSVSEMICGVLALVSEQDPVALRKYVSETEFTARYFSNEEESYSFEVADGPASTPTVQPKRSAIY